MTMTATQTAQATGLQALEERLNDDFITLGWPAKTWIPATTHNGHAVHDVLIIGAGQAGLALHVALGQVGIRPVLLDRAPHADAAARLFAQVETGLLPACLCATTVTTIHYIAEKTVGDRAARAHVASLMSMLELAPVTRQVIEHALASPMADFEDAVLAHAARLAGTIPLLRNRGSSLHAWDRRVPGNALPPSSKHR